MRDPAGSVPSTESPRSSKGRVILIAFIVIALTVGGFFSWQKFGHDASGGTESGSPFATQRVNDLTVNFIHPKGELHHAENEVLIEFRDTASGDLVEVGTVKFDLDMNMAGMVMHAGSDIMPTGTPGRYSAKVTPDMAGGWTASLRYDGPRGKGNFSFSVNVKP